MSSRKSDRSLKAPKPCRRVKREATQCVTAALEAVLNSTTDMRDPIMEQLKQCPEAFKVGEILGKLFDSEQSSRHWSDWTSASGFHPTARRSAMALLHTLG